MSMVRAVTLITIVLGLGLAPVHAQDGAETRPFLLGFTPFPYAISVEAVDYTYAALAAEGDLMVHHFDNGVPWPEALDGNITAHIQDDWNYRRAKTPAGHTVMVALTPINFERTGLAPYRGTADDQPLPSPWDSYGFDHPAVAAAYLNYVEEAIAFFQPDYLNIGIEVNLLARNNPSQWEPYLALHRAVYAALKADHPALPIFVSLTGIDLLEGYTDADPAMQRRAFADIIAYTDIFALSMYVYFTRYMTAEIPADMFDKLAALTDRPLAVAETGYPAQTFSIQISAEARLTFESDAARQEAFIRFLLAEAAQHNFLFVINFIVRDYDALWEQIGAPEDISIAWRDTGLFDEEGAERPALAVWRAWLALPYAGRTLP